MPKMPNKMVNRVPTGTYKGKLHNRSSGLVGTGGTKKGERKQPKESPAKNGDTVAEIVPKKINDIAAPLKSLIVDIESLTPDPDNARLHPERNMQAIRDSLALYGQLKPIVVRKETKVVVAGNGTLEAAKSLGWTKIAAMVKSMTDVEAVGYGLADNKTAELAKWNFETVARLDKLLQDQQHATIGWTSDELEVLRAADWTPPLIEEGEDYNGGSGKEVKCPECGHCWQL